MQGSNIQISISSQQLDLLDETGATLARYPISTSKYGEGSEEGSFKTPTGLFEICEMFGEDAPIRTIFRARRPVGIHDPSDPVDSDLVLTRILWLDGLEAHNANTKSRYIYLHGTNQEDLIGTPASIGCIRMRNEDIIELFDLCTPGMQVSILPSTTTGKNS